MGKKIAPFGSSEKFLREHVNFSGDECLIWPYRLTKSGYGLAKIDGYQTFASRWMCILAHGNPPDSNSQAAHNCGNPACVNPRHLRWASPKENCADRAIHGTENRGERSGKTNLTEADVFFIRNSGLKNAELGKMFGMRADSICRVKTGRRWWYLTAYGAENGVEFKE